MTIYIMKSPDCYLDGDMQGTWVETQFATPHSDMTFRLCHCNQCYQYFEYFEYLKCGQYIGGQYTYELVARNGPM